MLQKYFSTGHHVSLYDTRFFFLLHILVLFIAMPIALMFMYHYNYPIYSYICIVLTSLCLIIGRSICYKYVHKYLSLKTRYTIWCFIIILDSSTIHFINSITTPNHLSYISIGLQSILMIGLNITYWVNILTSCVTCYYRNFYKISYTHTFEDICIICMTILIVLIAEYTIILTHKRELDYKHRLKADNSLNHVLKNILSGCADILLTYEDTDVPLNIRADIEASLRQGLFFIKRRQMFIDIQNNECDTRLIYNTINLDEYIENLMKTTKINNITKSCLLPPIVEFCADIMHFLIIDSVSNCFNYGIGEPWITFNVYNQYLIIDVCNYVKDSFKKITQSESKKLMKLHNNYRSNNLNHGIGLPTAKLAMDAINGKLLFYQAQNVVHCEFSVPLNIPNTNINTNINYIRIDIIRHTPRSKYN